MGCAVVKMKANMNQVYDTIVIGTGIAGLTAAIHLKEAGQNVIVLTKNDKINECNTNYAQGGIIAFRPDDSAEALEKDIFYAGCYYNNQQAVKTLANEGPKLVFDFLIKNHFQTSDRQFLPAHHQSENQVIANCKCICIVSHVQYLLFHPVKCHESQ